MAPRTEIITQPSTREISPNIPPSGEVTSIQTGLAIIPVAFVITLAFVFIKQIKYRKNLYTQVVSLKHFYSIPCRKCQFFDNNQHLPCAVQPALVLSVEAVNCSDYAPKRR
ncbi:hypothetical protein IQ247_05885 [Plectonema cf. radiosum LEGE 06105]|uniref:Uncharacterized protein n=1 Tax=Plectonema cf. radiosum LEGE 06105 TaxID=945769 RepID=A0A8J7F4F8_9CYAN|nr:hypothetical protein [Plectonema radiosum]MBE9212244.1 hypothetical protein [Plectonema cf. radiosum LEGE 06105]